MLLRVAIRPTLALMGTALGWSFALPASAATIPNESSQLVEILYATSDGDWVPFSDLTLAEKEDLNVRQEAAEEHLEEAETLFDRVNELEASGLNPREIWSSLTPSEQEQLLLAIEPAMIEIRRDSDWSDIAEGISDGPALNGCKEKYEYVISRGLTGMELWRYTQYLYWCYDGSRVTYQSHNAWGTASGFGYQYQGSRTVIDQYKNNNWQYEYRSVGTFAYCLGWCFAYYTPWIHQIAYGNGNYSSYWGF
jgi:hypothetical protein